MTPLARLPLTRQSTATGVRLSQALPLDPPPPSAAEAELEEILARYLRE